MRLPRTRKLLVMLLSGAWLPATITCRPGDLYGVVRIVGDPFADVIVVDEYDTVYWDDGGYDLYVDVYDHHDY